MNRTPVYALSVISIMALVGCGPKADEPAPSSARPKPSPARLAVKTATDPDAAKIDLTPRHTTIEEIAATQGGDQVSGRTGPFETSTWEVDATIKSVQLKKDGDYYMVLQGEKGGQTVIEVPDPATCKGSPLEADITSARREIEARYHPTADVKNVNDKATLKGVGFLGWGNKSTGAKGKAGARLMPGTGIKFKAS
jgi:hypothetical protein